MVLVRNLYLSFVPDSMVHQVLQLQAACAHMQVQERCSTSRELTRVLLAEQIKGQHQEFERQNPKQQLV